MSLKETQDKKQQDIKEGNKRKQAKKRALKKARQITFYRWQTKVALSSVTLSILPYLFSTREWQPLAEPLAGSICWRQSTCLSLKDKGKSNTQVCHKAQREIVCLTGIFRVIPGVTQSCKPFYGAILWSHPLNIKLSKGIE